MADYPQPLQELLEDFSWIDNRRERTEMLIQYADQFEKVPEDVAMPPYPADHRVPACESEAYVWARQREDGALKLYFAVENPQGLSAMAMAAILDQTLSGLPPEQVVKVNPEIVYELFGNELSMGKGAGLTSMVNMVQALARQYMG
jgi:cysteine desulfuration protein SufE